MSWSVIFFIIVAVAIMFVLLYIVDAVSLYLMKKSGAFDKIDETIAKHEELLTTNNIFDEFEWEYLELLKYIKYRIEN